MLWQGEYPKCLACGWEDDRKPIRVVDTGIQVPLADDFETERLMFNEPEEVSQWQPGAHVSIARTYGPVVARVIEPPCGPVDGLLSPLGLRVKHLLSVEQGPVG